MAATGTIEIGGKELRWESPTIGDLEHFEAHIGPLTDPKVINSVKGRTYLAFLCLKKAGSKISHGEIQKLPNDDFIALWNMVIEAVPFLRRLYGFTEISPSPEEESTSPDSSGDAPSPSDGDQAKPDESE